MSVVTDTFRSFGQSLKFKDDSEKRGSGDSGISEIPVENEPKELQRIIVEGKDRRYIRTGSTQ